MESNPLKWSNNSQTSFNSFTGNYGFEVNEAQMIGVSQNSQIADIFVRHSRWVFTFTLYQKEKKKKKMHQFIFQKFSSGLANQSSAFTNFPRKVDHFLFHSSIFLQIVI